MGLEPPPLSRGHFFPPGARVLSLYRAIRPLLFALDPETAHSAACGGLSIACRLGLGRPLDALFRRDDPSLAVEVAGLRFPNPVGLAAGFDKDAAFAFALPALGFGFIEVGTVTPRPQPGNPRPRLFRVPEARGLINRMGFNNAGAEAAAARLGALKRRPVPIGVNIGINADAAPERAPEEYARAFSALEARGDYFVVNVSSPNTAGLRALQDVVRLGRILDALAAANPRRRPVFVKLAPDLDDAGLDSLLPLLREKASGLVCSNTTTSREGLSARWSSESGGLSGAPLRARATRMIARAFKAAGGRLPIIGCGGIFSAEDAYEKIRAGASLVQIYTGLIYEGPGLPGAICRGLLQFLKRDGMSNLFSAVGIDSQRRSK